MKKFLVGLAPLLILSFSGCQGSPEASNLPDTSLSDTLNPRLPTQSGDPKSGYSKAVMLFNGGGVSTSDWQTTETLIQSMGLSYDLVNTAQLNAMTLEQVASYGVMVVPGGSGGTIYKSLSEAARLKVRQAVRDYGMGYVGFCAGAWVAVGPESNTDQTASYGFAVAPGDVLPSWFPGGNSSLTAAVVPVTFADGSKRQLVWWGGPSTPEWGQGVVARYDNGIPAISETRSGKGYVVISGPHPEAPQGWRGTAGTDSDGLDYDLAKSMIQAALTQTPLATF